MAPQPTGDATLTDKDLDEAVESMFEEGDETPTEPPLLSTGHPATDDTPTLLHRTPPRPATRHPRLPWPLTRPEPASRARSPGRRQTVPVQGIRRRPDAPLCARTARRVRRHPERQAHRSPPRTGHGRELSKPTSRVPSANFDRKIRDAQTQRTAKDAEADAVIAWGAELAQKTPEELWQHLNEFQGNVPRYQLDLERRRLDEQRKQFEQQAKGPQLSEEEQREQFTENVQGELAATFAYLDRDDAFKGLTPEDKQTLRARWEKRPELLVRRATEDMPQHGITKGDVLFDPSNLLDDAKFILAHRKPVAQPSKAAAQNAIKNADQQVTNRIPPTARSAPPVAQQPRDKTGKFTDRKQFAKDFMADDDE
jgi:hypothetical protein